MNFDVRKRKAARAAKAAGMDGLLITHLPDVRYLSGFTGSNAVLAFSGGRAVLLTDGRYTVQAKAEAVGTRVIIATKPVLSAACEWLVEAGVSRCGFDASHTTVSALESMQKAVPAKQRRGMFSAVEPIVARLREVKDADEIARIRKSALLGCSLFDGMLEFLQAGLKEFQVAAAIGISGASGWGGSHVF
ncbi:MAG: aminopeptidase P family N-terminal domain-containing protein [Edaphobacter sp.]|uniref:aminopeptidase P family N-terminal domain-containing protein n=1 Tax=Edaphobacter sp. TaxID=1934404 RepID=UPI0023A60EB1|nr:aminopeptidase P family N-terminal domain-containing protein [Edaphobacter sp.]MDE1177263.1 aminopeptidase P family N-terminal domain-containing protein [Edaphobacter sp.]